MEGEYDAPMDGISDHEEAKTSNQTPKTLESRSWGRDTTVWMTVGEHHGKAVVRSAFPRLLDLEMG